MIPKILHYVWLGNGEKPELVQKCMVTWHQWMPETDGWTYMEWTEQTIEDLCKKKNLKSPIYNLQYCAEAYAAHKYAFVSDYVRLWALEQYGGVYLDTDVEVIRSFDELQEYNLKSPIKNQKSKISNLQSPTAFIGFEESLAHLLGTCVMGCEAHCQWVKDMLRLYENCRFKIEDGRLDLTTNVQRLGKAMVEKYGLVPNGKEQYVKIEESRLKSNEYLHVYPFNYFSPLTSTRVMRKTKDTFAIHHFAGSWSDQQGILAKLKASPAMCEIINAGVQLKRLIKQQR